MPLVKNVLVLGYMSISDACTIDVPFWQGLCGSQQLTALLLASEKATFDALHRSHQLRTASAHVLVIGVGTPQVSGTNTCWCYRKIPLALRAMCHVAYQRRWQAHDGWPSSANDMAAMAGFVVQADNAAPLVLHGAISFLVALALAQSVASWVG